MGRTPAGVRRLRQARDLARGQPPRHYPRHSKQAPPSSAARAGSLLTPHAEALKAGASKQRCQDWDLSARMASSNWRPDGTSARIAHGRSGALCPGGAPEDEALRASLAAALDARAEAERKSDGGRRERQGPQGGEGGAGQQSAGAQGRSGAGVASETGRKLHPLVAKRLAARAAALSGGDQVRADVDLLIAIATAVGCVALWLGVLTKTPLTPLSSAGGWMSRNRPGALRRRHLCAWSVCPASLRRLDHRLGHPIQHLTSTAVIAARLGLRCSGRNDFVCLFVSCQPDLLATSFVNCLVVNRHQLFCGWLGSQPASPLLLLSVDPVFHVKPST